MHEGLILALVSICVVFAALFLLYLFYGLMGEIFMRGASKPSPSEAVSAPAADDEEGARRAAAIAVALELQNRRTLTLQPGNSSWKSPEYNFRKPVEKAAPQRAELCQKPSAPCCFATLSGRMVAEGNPPQF